MKIILRCKDAAGLKLGPGGPLEPNVERYPGQPQNQIEFHEGFAEVDTEKFPDWEKWASGQGLWTIENLGENTEGLVAPGSTAFICDLCPDKTFKNQLGLNSHLKAHARAAAK